MVKEQSHTLGSEEKEKMQRIKDGLSRNIDRYNERVAEIKAKEERLKHQGKHY